MSKYLVMELEVNNVEDIVAGLKAIGFPGECIEVHETPVYLNGYLGDQRTNKANIIVRRENVRKYMNTSLPNDIGFLRTKDGAYNAVVSDYDTRWWNQTKGKFQQQAVVSKLTREARQKGYQIQQVKENGKIRMTLVSR